MNCLERIIIIVIGCLAVIPMRIAGVPVNLTTVTGSCLKSPPTFDPSKYYNLGAAAQTLPSDVSGSQWDLAKDNAFESFGVWWCEQLDYPTAKPNVSLLNSKGFAVMQSCDTSWLKSSRVNVIVIIDNTQVSPFSLVDLRNINDSYTSGTGIFLLTGSSPSGATVNRVLSSLPTPVATLSISGSANTPRSTLVRGSSGATPGLFDAASPIFSGVPSLPCGAGGGIPSSGSRFVPLAAAAVPSASGSAQSVINVLKFDPLMDFGELIGRRWGRVVVDTSLPRYGGLGASRTTTDRLALNAVAWTANAELNSTQSILNVYTGVKLISCSSGDTFTLEHYERLCSVAFIPTSLTSAIVAPSCLSSSLTFNAVSLRYEYTCRLSPFNGGFWITANGKNTTSYLFSSSLVQPRSYVTALSAPCLFQTGISTRIINCIDNKWVNFSWSTAVTSVTFTYGGLVSVVTCDAVVAAAANEYGCKIGHSQNATAMIRGWHSMLVNGISSGIALHFDVGWNLSAKLICSQSKSLTPTRSRSHHRFQANHMIGVHSDTATLSLTVTRSMSRVTSYTISTNGTSGTITETGTTSITLSHAYKLLLAQNESSLSSSPEASTTTSISTNCSTESRTISFALSLTKSRTRTETTSISVSPSRSWRMTYDTSSSLSPTMTDSWGCVNATDLGLVFASLERDPLHWTVPALAAQTGVNLTGRVLPINATLVRLKHLRVPWFQTQNCTGRLRKRWLPNQLGYWIPISAMHPSPRFNVSFRDGFSVADFHSDHYPAASVYMVVTSAPQYRIYEDETVDIEIPLSCLTLSFLCNASLNPSTNLTEESVEGAKLMRLTVIAPRDETVMTARRWMGVLGTAMMILAPLPCTNVQLMVALSRSRACSNSFQRLFFGNWRLLQPLSSNSFSDGSWSGAVIGALVATLSSMFLHKIIIGVVALVRKKPVAEMTQSLRYPWFTLRFTLLPTFAGTVFGSVSLLGSAYIADKDVIDVGPASDSGDQTLGWVGLILIGGCFPLYVVYLITRLPKSYCREEVLIPASMVPSHGSPETPEGMEDELKVNTRSARSMLPKELVEVFDSQAQDHPTFLQFRFSAWKRSWRKGDRQFSFGAPILQWLSYRVMPFGTWAPRPFHRTFGEDIITIFCRPERFWFFVPLLSAYVVAAAVGAPPNLDLSNGCETALSMVSLFFALRAAAYIVLRPFRSLVETALFAVSDVFMVIFVVALQANMASPLSVDLERYVVWTFAMVWVVAVIHTPVQLFATYFVEPSLSREVPTEVVFHWRQLTLPDRISTVVSSWISAVQAQLSRWASEDEEAAILRISADVEDEMEETEEEEELEEASAAVNLELAEDTRPLEDRSIPADNEMQEMLFGETEHGAVTALTIPAADDEAALLLPTADDSTSSTLEVRTHPDGADSK